MSIVLVVGLAFFVFFLFVLVVVKRRQQQQLRARQLAAGMREPMLADNGAGGPGGAVPRSPYGAVPDAVLAEGPVNPNLYGGEGNGNGNDLIPQAREVSGDVRVDVNRNHQNGSYQQSAAQQSIIYPNAASGGHGAGYDAERKAEEAQEADQAAALAVRRVNQTITYRVY
jgi:hypothetical protein